MIYLGLSDRTRPAILRHSGPALPQTLGAIRPLREPTSRLPRGPRLSRQTPQIRSPGRSRRILDIKFIVDICGILEYYSLHYILNIDILLSGETPQIRLSGRSRRILDIKFILDVRFVLDMRFILDILH